MLPTYHDREINIINHLAYLRHEPQRGDVVAIRINPDDAGSHNGLAGEFKTLPHAMFFKRIIGLPGETVAFSNGRVLINSNVLNEPYETGDCHWDTMPITLSSNEYYVVGDNREMDEPLHVKGAVKRGQIVGKALL